MDIVPLESKVRFSRTSAYELSLLLYNVVDIPVRGLIAWALLWLELGPFTWFDVTM
jgi:hypothetical protein